jgi:endo-1,4-beta-xylanase
MPRGDTNGDGEIDIIDALLVAQYYVGLPVNIDTSAADTDCDGSITIIDALLIGQYYVGLITRFC